MQLIRTWWPLVLAAVAIGAWLAGVELHTHGDFLAPLLFGNSDPFSKKSSSSTSNANTTTTNTDRRQVVDGGSVGVSSDGGTVNVSSTDHDAIKRSFDLATVSSTNNLESINAAVKFAGDALRLSGEGTKAVQSSLLAGAANIGDAYKVAQDSASGLRFVVGAGLVVALVVGVLVFNKKKAA